MGRKSSIKSLPPKIQTAVNEAIKRDATIDEIVEKIEELAGPGITVPGRSSVGRYKKSIEEVGEHMRRSREIADALVKEIGPGAAEGKTGRLLVEILQNIAFKYMMRQVEGKEIETDAQELMFLGRMLKDTASARKIDVDTEAKLRKEFADKLDDAVKEAEAAGEKGLSTERVAQLRREFLGVRE